MDVVWRAFPLHPETPSEGFTLEELFAGRSINIPQMMLRLKRVASEEGLPFGERKKTFNSRLAQELGKWAELQGKGDEFHRAVFHAYFAEGKNICKVTELLEVAQLVGLALSEAQGVLQRRSFKEAVDSDWERAYRLGVTAVPTFLMDHQHLVGAQPYEALEKLLAVNGVRRRVAY